MPAARPWPSLLWLVRHGQSLGNVANDAAHAAGAPLVDIAQRDMDVPLSELGEQQAAALGRWFGELPADERPEVAVVSPYVRAAETARRLLAGAGLSEAVPVRVDERLREREFGVLDRLTRIGIREREPQQYELRSRVGKFYHRPPGGESWADVGLRVRSLLRDLRDDQAAARVLIVAHQVVILMLRYVIDDLGEADILSIAQEDVANTAVSSYRWRPGLAHPALDLWNHTAPVAEQGAPVTAEPDTPVAPR